ncbi:MAG TPA: M15 family metallopeptidase [Actinomycetota bacterium]|nr:M15 family metallopeptidase [Actinomycetota bacterium]
MRRRMGLVAAMVLGAVAGGLLMLSLPTAGKLPGPSGPATTPPARPAVEKAEVPTLLAWTPGGLPAGLADAARAVPGVTAVAEVRSGVAWLSSWTNRTGSTARAPLDLRVPVEMAAVDPAEYAEFVPPTDRTAFLELGAGNALLSRTGAGLRGLDSEGSLSFADVDLAVRGMVEDELIGAHELVVSTSTGAAVGVTTPRYLLIAMGPGGDRQLVQETLESALPPGSRLRLRGPGETPFFRHGDAVLPLVRVKELFGEFAGRPQPDGTVSIDPGWLSENITTVSVPLLGSVRCHKALIPQLTAAMDEIGRRGLGGLVRATDFGGCFSPRFLNRDSESGLSRHAWGIAVDLNVSENPFGSVPALDQRLVEILERWGFTWGGRWLVPDGMHFEFLRWPLSPKG